MLINGRDDYVETLDKFECTNTIYLARGFTIKEFDRRGHFGTYFYYLYDPEGRLILTDFSYQRVIGYYNKIITNRSLLDEILEGERKWTSN